jgi:hypothetical protein
MRLVIWLALPVAILGFAVLFTIVLSWSQGGSFCSTWMSAALPLCR